MDSIIQQLINELKTNADLKDSAVVRVVLESINNSLLLGIPSEQVLSTTLSNLDDLAKATVNENLQEVVSKFKKMADKSTPSLQNMAKAAGISLKIKSLKESKIAKDPTFANLLFQIDSALSTNPEFRLIAPVYEALSKFRYDPTVSRVLSEIDEFVKENRPMLEVMNSVYEMRQASPIMYKDAIAILEECLLAGQLESDTIRMKMRGKVELPTVNRLINVLSMMEGKSSGKFNIGLGNGDAKVKPVIAPFIKLDENSALVLIDNSFVRLSEDKDPEGVSPDEAKSHADFYSVCEAFVNLNFTEVNGEMLFRGRHITVSFAVNESGNLHLKVNGKEIDDLTKIDVSEVFMMESLETRANLVKIFNSLDMIVNLEFAKKIVNERLDKDSIVFTISDDIFVFEKLGGTRIIKKMKSLAFHNYVMENFQYDISELFAIELEERDKELRGIDEEKIIVEKDIQKLEESVAKLDETLKDTTLSTEHLTQLTDLKESILKNINALKSRYIELDQSKKKV